MALLCAPAAVGRCEDFNEARLQAGRADYQAKKYIEAIDEFRIAAFGYLDQPVVLSECLVRLSLAQSAAGKTADVDGTLNRFLEVERRFGAYPKANLDPETRASFRALLTQRIPEAMLVTVPSLSSEQQRRGAQNASAPSTPTTTSVARAGSAGKPAPQGAKAMPAATSSVDIAARSRVVLAESQSQVSAGKAGEAVNALTGALKADPSNRDLRLALLEATCLTRAYFEGAAQVPLVAPFAEAESPSMFYAAVVLYETGKTDEARGYMTRAASKVSGPLVDEYAKKIMGKP